MRYRTAFLALLTMSLVVVAYADWPEAKAKPGDSKELSEARLRLSNMGKLGTNHPAVREQIQKIQELEKTKKK